MDGETLFAGPAGSCGWLGGERALVPGDGGAVWRQRRQCREMVAALARDRQRGGPTDGRLAASREKIVRLAKHRLEIIDPEALITTAGVEVSDLQRLSSLRLPNCSALSYNRKLPILYPQGGCRCGTIAPSLQVWRQHREVMRLVQRRRRRSSIGPPDWALCQITEEMEASSCLTCWRPKTS